jgi:hypothetical protein
MDIGLDIGRSVGSLIAASTFNSLPPGVKEVFSADENRLNLCRGAGIDNRVNLACIFGINPAGIGFSLDLSASLADLLGIKASINSLIGGMISGLSHATVNLWVVDKFYAEMQSILESIDPSVINAPKLALVALQADLGKQALDLMAVGTGMLADSVGGMFGGVVGAVMSTAADSVNGDINKRIDEEIIALETINNTATVLMKDSIIALQIIMPCLNKLISFVKSRRKATTVKLMQTGTVKGIVGIAARTSNILNAPIVGKITVTAGTALKMLSAAQGSKSTLSTSVSGSGSISGSGNFFGSTVVTSISKSSPRILPKIKSSSLSLDLGAPRTLLPPIPDYSRSLELTQSTQLNRIFQTERVPLL